MKGILQLRVGISKVSSPLLGLCPLEQLGRVSSSCSHAVPCSAKTPNCSRPRGTLASPGHTQSCLGPDSIFWGCTKPGRLGPAQVKRPDFRGVLLDAASTTRWVCLAESLLAGSQPALPCTYCMLRPSASPHQLSAQRGGACAPAPPLQSPPGH